MVYYCFNHIIGTRKCKSWHLVVSRSFLGFALNCHEMRLYWTGDRPTLHRAGSEADLMRHLFLIACGTSGVSGPQVGIPDKEILEAVHWRTTRCQKMMGNFPITSSFWAIFSFETNFWASFPTFNLWFTHIGTQLGCVSYERGMGFRDIEDVYPVISPFNYI